LTNPRVRLDGVRRCLAAVALIALTGCANIYVDGATQEVDAAKYKRAAPPHAVQLLVEFQTKGVANARATEHVKARILDQVKRSGIFSAVEEAPVNGGALLAITINNVPLQDDAFAKGFVTGLTFGLAGSQVSDGYVCTATYTPVRGAAPIIKQARHAIHTTVGAAAAPGNATKVDNVDAAVSTMTRQVVSNVLNDVTNDSSFK
jgi:hypothetical protein